MTTINLFNDYNIFDASKKENLQLLESTLLATTNDIIFNIERCIIDYPETSAFIDYIINALTKLKGSKTLTITTDLNVNELLLMHLFFIGSSFFDIHETSRNLDLKAFKLKIESKLFDLEIKIIIIAIGKNKTPEIKYEYGISKK